MNERVKAIVTGIVALLTLANVILQAFGISPIPVDESLIFTTVSSVAAIIALVVAWWKNQNVTQASEAGQKVVDAVKANKVSETQVIKFLDKIDKAA